MKEANTSSRKSAVPLYLVLLILLLIFSIAHSLTQSSQGQFEEIDPDKVVRVMAEATPVSTATPLPMDVYRAERSASLESIQVALAALIENEAAGEDVRALAEETLLQYTRDAHSALLVESALQGLGYGDAVCAVQNGQVTVFLPAPIDENDCALLIDLIREWTGAGQDAIRLVQGI